MSNASEIKLSDAFNLKLKELVINEFPCSNGKWRSGNTWRCDSPDLLNPQKDPSAGLESVQSLLEMMENEPFKTDADWSENCDQLRKLAIKNPEKITRDNIFGYFTMLRLVGMNIFDVDDMLLKFVHLKELTLSANKIQSIILKNFPKKLEVLELYGNKVASIDKFCCSLPYLVHLGIGNNALTTVAKTVHQNCWSHMLSLDLSFNGLTSLKETLDTLKNLPKLSNLLLQGNPISLASSYRGVVVDTLKQLTILDDVRVTADEKHRFKGISKLKGISVDEAVLELQLHVLKGVKAPPNLENENGSEEFPKTEYRYQISYPFLINCSVKKPPKTICEVLGNEKDPEANPEIEERLSASETDDEIIHDDPRTQNEGRYLLKRKAKERNWCEEEIKIGHERKLITTDLLNFKRFLLEGMQLDLIENKVVVSLDSPDDYNSLIGDGDAEKSTKGGKSKATQKDKPKQLSIPKTNASKGKRKAKGEEMPLYELSRESKTIGTINLSMADFVHGTKFLEKQCTFAIENTIDSESEAQQEELKDSKVSNSKKPPSLDGRKKGKDARKLSPSPTVQRNRSAMSNKTGKGEKQEKNAKSKDSKILSEIAENEAQPPSEITLDICITLHSWQNANEAQDWVADNS